MLDTSLSIRLRPKDIKIKGAHPAARPESKTNGPPETGRPLCFVYQALALFARFAMRLILRAAVFL